MPSKGPMQFKLHAVFYIYNITTLCLFRAVTDLDVLPTCEYTSLYAKPHKIKPYHGVYEVRESKVSLRDDTWYKHWKKKDKGNPLINKEVSNHNDSWRGGMDS